MDPFGSSGSLFLDFSVCDLMDITVDHHFDSSPHGSPDAGVCQARVEQSEEGEPLFMVVPKKVLGQTLDLRDIPSTADFNGRLVPTFKFVVSAVKYDLFEPGTVELAGDLQVHSLIPTLILFPEILGDDVIVRQAIFVFHGNGGCFINITSPFLSELRVRSRILDYVQSLIRLSLYGLDGEIVDYPSYDIRMSVGESAYMHGLYFTKVGVDSVMDLDPLLEGGDPCCALFTDHTMPGLFTLIYVFLRDGGYQVLYRITPDASDQFVNSSTAHVRRIIDELWNRSRPPRDVTAARDRKSVV